MSSCFFIIWCCACFLVYTSLAFKSSIPVINYGHLQSTTTSIQSQEIQKLKNALQTYGFFILTNHQIPKQIMDSAWNKSIEFFKTSTNNKQSVSMTSTYIYGYQNKEILSNSISSETETETSMNLDFKETFQVYIGDEKHANERLDDVQWPPLPLEMDIAWIEYYRACELIVKQILRSISIILNVTDIHFIDKYTDDHFSALRSINYYPLPIIERLDSEMSSCANAYRIRCSEHSDWGFLTLLRQDVIGGLQVQNNDGVWLDCISDFYDFVINIGDLFEVLTEHEFRSRLHRVIDYNNVTGEFVDQKSRHSMAYFYTPSAETFVCPLNKESEEEECISVFEYLTAKHQSTQTD